jgi:hypothetical protein
VKPEGSLPCSWDPSTFPCPESDKSSLCPPLHPVSQRLILILSSHLCLDFPSGLLLLCFPPNSCMYFCFPPHVPHAPSNMILLYLITLKLSGEQHTSRSSLCSSPQSPMTSSLLDPNIFPSTLLLNTLSLCFSLNVGDKFYSVACYRYFLINKICLVWEELCRRLIVDS